MVWVVVALLLIAATVDAHDRHRKRSRRSSSEMLRRRHDELADVWSTQHSGYPQPMYDLHTHRDALDAH